MADSQDSRAYAARPTRRQRNKSNKSYLVLVLAPARSRNLELESHDDLAPWLTYELLVWDGGGAKGDAIENVYGSHI